MSILLSVLTITITIAIIVSIGLAVGAAALPTALFAFGGVATNAAAVLPVLIRRPSLGDAPTARSDGHAREPTQLAHGPPPFLR